jgi:hypothetical protein
MVPITTSRRSERYSRRANVVRASSPTEAGGVGLVRRRASRPREAGSTAVRLRLECFAAGMFENLRLRSPQRHRRHARGIPWRIHRRT